MKALKWIILNFSMLGLFIAGNLTENTGLLAITVFMLWYISIIGITMFSKNILDGMKKHPAYSVPKSVNYAFDFFMLAVIVYFGYVLLGTAYLLHILGFENYRSYRKEKGIPDEGITS